MPLFCKRLVLVFLIAVPGLLRGIPAFAQTPADTKPAPASSQVPGIDLSTYRVGPEDVLEISVWREDALKKEALVRPDGGISYPLIGEVQAAGKTVLEIREEIAKRLEKFIPDPVVSVAILKIGSQRVYVIGKVNKPGISRWADTWTFSRRSAWRAASRRLRTRTTFASCAAMASVRSCCRSSTAASCAGRNSSRTSSCARATWSSYPDPRWTRVRRSRCALPPRSSRPLPRVCRRSL